MTQTATVQFCRIDHCPSCHRKLCRRKEIDGDILVEFKHKGSEVLAQSMIIKCLGCQRKFLIAADDDLIHEVDLGNS